MLPDKNELNDELMEQISGGLEYTDFANGQPKEIEQYYRCKKCYAPYKAYKPSESGLCPNCEPGPLETSIPIGDIKTTVPDLSKMDKLVKIH